MKKGISKKTLDMTMSKVKFLPKVIEYDRYQPEFYEDTKTYVSKRANSKKIKTGIKIYNKNKKVIDKITKEFSVDKNLLLSLMGIETNFGNYLGKMDIVSSLATLSFDKRRSEFFTEELIILLKLVDKNIIDPKIEFLDNNNIDSVLTYNVGCSLNFIKSINNFWPNIRKNYPRVSSEEILSGMYHVVFKKVK